MLSQGHYASLTNQSIHLYSAQRDKDCLHPTTQSGPDSQTAPPQSRNTTSGCNAVRSLHHNTGFAVGTADARSCKPARPFSDGSRRCIRRTIRDCHGCRSSRVVCRFGRCGNRRGIALRLGCYGRLRLGVRSCLCRCTPAIGGCCRKCCAAARCRRSRGGYGGRCGRVGRPVGKCRSRNRLRQTAAARRRRGRRFGRGRLKNRNRVRAYRTHTTQVGHARL